MLEDGTEIRVFSSGRGVGIIEDSEVFRPFLVQLMELSEEV